MVVPVAPVNREIVIASPAAIYAHDPRAVASVYRVQSNLRLHPGLQLKQLVGVALRQGQLADSSLSYNGAELRRRRIHQRRRPRNFNAFARRAYLQHDIHCNYLVQVKSDTLPDVLLEPLYCGVDFVRADRHLDKNVFAVLAGLH